MKVNLDVKNVRYNGVDYANNNKKKNLTVQEFRINSNLNQAANVLRANVVSVTIYFQNQIKRFKLI